MSRPDRITTVEQRLERIERLLWSIRRLLAVVALLLFVSLAGSELAPAIFRLLGTLLVVGVVVGFGLAAYRAWTIDGGARSAPAHEPAES